MPARSDTKKPARKRNYKGHKPYIARLQDRVHVGESKPVTDRQAYQLLGDILSKVILRSYKRGLTKQMELCGRKIVSIQDLIAVSRRLYPNKNMETRFAFAQEKVLKYHESLLVPKSD